MASHIEQFDALLVVPLDRSSTEEHVRHFSKSQGCVRLSKQDISRDDVNIPLCKICAQKHQQMDYIGETKWQ